MTFRKPCGSSQSDVCGNVVIIASLPTWFSLAVIERECTLVDTVVFLPKKPNYLGTRKHYSVFKVLWLYSYTGVKKWKRILCLRAARLIPVAEARGLTARFDKSACLYNPIIQDISCRSLHSSLASWTGIQFNPSQDQVSNTSEDEAKLEANVHTIGTNQFSNRPDIIYLGST